MNEYISSDQNDRHLGAYVAALTAVPPSLGAGSNRLVEVLGLYLRSPDPAACGTNQGN